MTILDEIYQYKLSEVAENKKCVSVEQLKETIQRRVHAQPFGSALKTSGKINIIAEVKKASPSQGIIRKDFQPVAIAKIYESNGAAAISVLTDVKYFQGSLKYLTDIKNTVHLPILRKDFIVDSYQIYEARSAGADAILLIAALLSEEEIQSFLNTAENLGMDCLVEAHSADELEKVLRTKATIIGINNRDLKTFRTDLEITFQLKAMIPEDKIVVSESGIKSRSDILKLQEHGIHAVLIGETLMKSDNIPSKLCELLGM
ncbi:indole-3-glycerol phosphate synthase TrpC [Candidatus Kuenenia sp.]|uniref:indole-3-glycerol phosphate synthase TrpC n=1 Tax=Candidatus Kuenenia sp. TaxID=2499824 RepID=UPI0032209BA0